MNVIFKLISTSLYGSFAKKMYLCNCNHQKTDKIMANTKLLLVEDDENLAYMEKSCFEDIIGGYERSEERR